MKWCCRAVVVAAAVVVADGRNGWKSDDGFDKVRGELAVVVDEQEIFELGEAGGVDADLKWYILRHSFNFQFLV